MGVVKPAGFGGGITAKGAAGSLPVLYALGATFTGVAPASCGAYVRNSIVEGVRTTTVTVTEVGARGVPLLSNWALLTIRSPCTVEKAGVGAVSRVSAASATPSTL